MIRIFLVLSVAGFIAVGATMAAPLKVGDKAPTVLGLNSDGDAAAVRPWKWGNGHTLLVFWSPNDVASVRQVAELRKLHREFGSDNRLQIVSVVTAIERKRSNRELWESWLTFIGKEPEVIGPGGKLQPFDSAWMQLFEAELFSLKNFPADDRGLTTTGRYGVSELPAAFLVDKDGRLAASQIAADQLKATVSKAVAASAKGTTASGMQELFDLSVRQKKLLFELELLNKRLANLEKEQFGRFDRVADPTDTEYWESVSDTVLKAKAKDDIQSGDLLLYHAPGIYRIKDGGPKLTTNGECWYFRPDCDIRKGQEFTIIGTKRSNNPEGAAKAEISIPGRPRK